jgi:hypothetical protein
VSAAVEVTKPKRVAKPKVSGKPIPAWALGAMSGDITAEWKLRGGGEWLADPRAERPAVLAFDVASRGGWFFLAGAGEGHTLIAKNGIDRSWAAHVDLGLVRANQFRTKITVPYFGIPAEVDLSPPPVLVVVEDTNIGFARVTPIAALAGARYVGGVVALASAAGLPVLRVSAQTWQLAMLTPDRKRLNRADGKAASRALATSHFGAAITSEDVADAACLALWARGGRP